MVGEQLWLAKQGTVTPSAIQAKPNLDRAPAPPAPSPYISVKWTPG